MNLYDRISLNRRIDAQKPDTKRKITEQQAENGDLKRAEHFDPRLPARPLSRQPQKRPDLPLFIGGKYPAQHDHAKHQTS